jgi:hypothetical protein
MSAVAQHDYVGRVREEVAVLERELGERGAREELEKIAGRLELAPEVALAAVFRAGRRSGLSLRLMLTELANQLDQAERPGA